MSETRFVYVTYIRTTPEKLWRALTTREFLAQYWPGGPAGVDAQAGAPVKWEIGGEVRDLGGLPLRLAGDQGRPGVLLARGRRPGRRDRRLPA